MWPGDLAGMPEIALMGAWFAQNFISPFNFTAVAYNLSASLAGCFITRRTRHIRVINSGVNLLHPKQSAVRHTFVGFQLAGMFSLDFRRISIGQIAGFFC